MFFVLLVLLHAPYLHSFSCFRASFSSPTSEFPSTNLASILTDRDKTIISSWDGITRCRISMVANYTRGDGNVMIDYGDPQTSDFGGLRFYTKITLEKSHLSLLSWIDYVCLPPNSCDQNLVTEWIQWLVDVNNKGLQIISDSSSQKCHIWGRTVENSVDGRFYVCDDNLEINHLNDVDNSDNGQINSINIKETTTPVFSNNSCKYSKYTSKTVSSNVLIEMRNRCFHGILSKTNDKMDLISNGEHTPAVRVTSIPNENTQLISEKVLPSVSRKALDYKDRLKTIITIVVLVALALVSCVICVVCFGICRKNRQGYSAASTTTA